MNNQDWLNKLKIIECPDATYAPEKNQLVIDRAKGSTIWDCEGKAYTDLCAGFGALVLGHNPDCHKVFWQSLCEDDKPYAVHGLGDVYPSRAKIGLLQTLKGLLPDDLSVGTLAISGSQAVEVAIKTALLATKKSGLISFKGGYHGVDLGSLAVSERLAFREPFLQWIAKDMVEFCKFGSPLAELRQDLSKAFAKQKEAGIGTAAMIVEPVQGRAGVALPPKGWLEEIHKFCHENSVLLIFDEVFTGLGRLGQMTYAETVPCDLLCLGKALGGGMPISACFGRREVMSAWPDNAGEAIHTGTFFGHPLSCQIAEITLKEILRQKLAERSLHIGAEAQEFLRKKLGSQPSIKEIRGQGLMLAIEFRQAGYGAQAMDALRMQGVIAIPSGEFGQCLALSPALNIESDELFKALEKVVDVASSLS